MDDEASPGTGVRPTAEMSVDDLVGYIVDDTVRTADLAAGRWLVAELERRGDAALWGAMLTLLRPLAARPVYDLPERQGIDYLRRIARGPSDPVTALLMGLSAAYRELGEETAREIWHHATAELRSTAVLRELISRSLVLGSQGRRLSPVQAVALNRGTFRSAPGRTGGTPFAGN